MRGACAGAAPRVLLGRSARASRARRFSQVHAFNPHPIFVKNMRENLVINHIERTVCIHDAAVSGSSGQADLAYSVFGASPAAVIGKEGFSQGGRGEEQRGGDEGEKREGARLGSRRRAAQPR